MSILTPVFLTKWWLFIPLHICSAVVVGIQYIVKWVNAITIPAFFLIISYFLIVNIIDFMSIFNPFFCKLFAIK